MKINKKFLPIKIHYFLFLGCASPVYPFIVVVARQLGIPVVFQGTITAIILVATLLIKPLVAAAADAFPNRRKLIFLLILILMVGGFFNIVLLPPMHGVRQHHITGSVIFGNPETNLSTNRNISHVSEEFYLHVKDNISCFPESLWDCKADCNFTHSFFTSHILLDKNQDNFKSSSDDFDHDSKIYYMENVRNYSSYCEPVIKLQCEGALYDGKNCNSLWQNPLFYVYLMLLSIGYVTYAIGNSVTDAICMDLIGENGDYGNERAWGTVGWGLMGPISGFFIDWYSGDKYGKQYLPAFLILLCLGSVDVILSAAKLKVPRIKRDDNIWNSLKMVLKKPSFILFLSFVIMAGSFDGVVAHYIFVLQEDMAKDTPYMRYMKFLQGLTIGIQCFFEAPFMWIFGWILNRLGSSGVLSLVFFLYIFRLFGLALVGSYGPVWLTLITEILNGPCYGLGYTAIVVQAGVLTPPGTSTSVQSITNICYESLGYALASLLGGILFASVGSPGIYYGFGIMSLVTFVLHLISLRWEKPDEDKSSSDKTESPLKEAIQLKEKFLSENTILEDKQLFEDEKRSQEIEREKFLS